MSSFIARRAAAVARPSTLRAFSTTPSRPFAKITIVGHLADTPELQATSTGREIVKYAIASNHGPKDNRQVSWFRVTSFQPEGPGRDYTLSLPKGTHVYVEGDASINTWEDSEGKKNSTLNVVQRNLEVLKRPHDHE